MALLKAIFSALIVAGAASAQACSATATTIQNSGDATALASCQTFTGDVVIETGTTDNIRLDGLERLDGSIIARNVSRLTEISSSTLERISDAFELEELQILSTLNFPRLRVVETIRWEALPALQALTFDSQVQLAAVVDIQNTQLNSLEGINLRDVDRFYIANNPYLREIRLQLQTIGEAITLEANARDLVVSFPNLEWAFNMTLRNVSDLALPSLSSVNGSMGIYSGGFETFGAPNLTTVGQSLSFVGNDAMTNISLPELTKVNGGFQIANNSALETIDGFPKLETVGGALDFTGSFTDVDLPALDDVRGAFNMQSTQDIEEECERFRELSGTNNVIKGKFMCEGQRERPTGVDEDEESSDGDSGSAAPCHVGPVSYFVAAASGLVAFVLCFF